MSASRFYFCYSSSLDEEAFNVWKQNHGYLDFRLGNGERALLPNFSVAFNLFSNYWGGRVLGLESSPGSQVEGILFEIPSNDWPIIEHKEGLKTGLSQMLEVEVKLVGSGKELKAWAFSTPESRRTSSGPISSSFRDLVMKAYKKWGLVTDLNTFC